MQGVDTLLFSLCHGNNAKPDCPTLCLSNCIYISFLSPARIVRFLLVLFSLSLHHSSPLEPIISFGRRFLVPAEGTTEKRIYIYFPCRQHHTFTNTLLKSRSRDFNSSPCCLCPPLTLLLVLSWLDSWNFSWRGEEVSCCLRRRHTARWHIICLSVAAAGGLPQSPTTSLSALSPHPWLSAVHWLKAYPRASAELPGQWTLTTFPLFAVRTPLLQLWHIYGTLPLLLRLFRLSISVGSISSILPNCLVQASRFDSCDVLNGSLCISSANVLLNTRLWHAAPAVWWCCCIVFV